MFSMWECAQLCQEKGYGCCNYLRLDNNLTVCLKGQGLNGPALDDAVMITVDG